MNTSAPSIGSRITLVSKSEIRYDGILYEVDTKNATVTLSQVRSFGTEDRPVPKPIPGRDDVYEYIVFRGSDIKDLSIHGGPGQDLPQQDPAILSTSKHPPLLNPPPVPSLLGMPGSGHTPPQLMTPLPPPGVPRQSVTLFPGPGSFSGPFGPYFRPPTMMVKQGPIPFTQAPPSQRMIQPALIQPASIQPASIQPALIQPASIQPASTQPAFLSIANTSTPISTVSNISHISASPIPVLGIKPSTQTTSHSVVTQATSLSTHTSVSQGTTSSGSGTQLQASETASSTTGSRAKTQGSRNQPSPQKKSKTTTASQAVVAAQPAHSSSSAGPVQSSPPTVTFITNQPTQTKSVPKVKEAKGTKALVTSTTPPTEDSTSPSQQSSSGTSRSKNQQQQRTSGRRGGARARDHNSQYRERAYYPQEDSQYQSRGWRGRNRDGPDRYYNQQKQRSRYPGKVHGRDSKEGGGSDTNKQTLRYDADFDFETANARFDREQLEKEMKKMTVDDDTRNAIGAYVDCEPPQSPDVIVLEDEEGDEQQVDGALNKVPLYNKDDFFDSISCESMQIGGNRRPNRNAERSINTETFGTYSGGYGGRGRYSYGRGGRYGRGRGGYQNHRYNYYDQRRGGYGGKHNQGEDYYDQRRGGYGGKHNQGGDRRGGRTGPPTSSTKNNSQQNREERVRPEKLEQPEQRQEQQRDRPEEKDRPKQRDWPEQKEQPKQRDRLEQQVQPEQQERLEKNERPEPERLEKNDRPEQQEWMEQRELPEQQLPPPPISDLAIQN